MKCDSPTLAHLHGPLDVFLAPYAEQLRAQQYARSTARAHMLLVADFDRWLGQRHVAASEVTPQHAQQYLRYRTHHDHRLRHGDAAALQRLLTLLRQRGIIGPLVPVVSTPAARLLGEFDCYLQQERALAPATRRYHRSFVGLFLTERFATGPIDLSGLCPSDVTAFVQRHATRYRTRVRLMTMALRSFLRFARQCAEITTDLAAAVPSVARWSLSTLPRSLPPDHVQRVLAHCNQQAALGRRDFAILLLLARLGLRAGEVAALTLEDIDWQVGRLTVRGKGGHVCHLPLPVDVGSAIATYLQDGRPRGTTSRCVFLRGPAPAIGFKGQQGVGSVVKHALARAGIDSPRRGSHLFRHTLATQMLQHGASLAEIGELLRHRCLDTTAIYAKVDLVALRTLALPWPGGAR